jgi:hypothetical protein
MIKAFKKNLKNFSYDEVRIIDTDTRKFTSYMQNKEIGFIFSKYETNIINMGYKSVDECIKTLKERGCLGNEVDYTEQKLSEKIGLINLGIERIKKHNRINTLDFEDVIYKLSDYGLGYTDAQNQIIANYQNGYRSEVKWMLK